MLKMNRYRGWFIRLKNNRLFGLLGALSLKLSSICFLMLASSLFSHAFPVNASSKGIENSTNAPADTIEVSVTAGDVCLGSDVEVRITGLDSGFTYNITYIISGADSTGVLDTVLQVKDSIRLFTIPASVLQTPGIDTFSIVDIDGDGVAGTNYVVFEVLPWPAITSQPQGREICINEDFTLSVGVNDPGLMLQWEKKSPADTAWNILLNDTVYQGVNDSILQVTYNDVIDSNWFRVKVYNQSCNIYSDSVQLFIDTTPPEFINCPGDTLIQLGDGECSAEYDLSQIYLISNIYDKCERINDLSLGFTPSKGIWDPFEIGTTKVEIKATDINGNVSYCRFNVEVIGAPPRIDCPDSIFQYVDPGECGASVVFDEPVFNHECIHVEDTRVLRPGKKSGDFFPLGLTTVRREVWWQGETIATCSFKVEINDNIDPELFCPDDTTLITDPGKTTVQFYYDFDFDDNCKDYINIIEPPGNLLSGSEFPLGTTPVTWGVSDFEGDVTTCTFDVKVLDAESPVITCPGDIDIILEPTVCDTFLTIDIPDAQDNDTTNQVIITNSINGTSNASGNYTVGETVITWIATDFEGNKDSCHQTVNIRSTPVAIADAISLAMNDSITFSPVGNDEYCRGYAGLMPLNILIPPVNGEAVTTGDDWLSIDYTPNHNFFGTDSVLYEICTDGQICDSAWVTITVNVIVVPVALETDTFISLNGEPVAGNVLENDKFTKDTPFSVTLASGPTHAEIFTLDTLGNINYTPYAGFRGVDSFMYTLCDFRNECKTSLAVIMVLDDTDLDDVADFFDVDDDNDGIPDEIEGSSDFDNDGIPNSLDIDSDNDGIVDNIEAQPEGAYIAPSGIDDNQNGLDDAYDINAGGTPIAVTNSDDDTQYDFLDNDSDNDNVPDSIEGNDSNSDGLADIVAMGTDSDNDGLDDAFDLINGFGIPGNETGSNAPLQDTDGDNIRDWRDTDDDGDSKTTLQEDLNNDGNAFDDDSDYDGIPDYLDAEDYCELIIPNGFSPNGDGIADVFYIKCIQLYPDAELVVFNRWGQKVFVKKHYGNTEAWGETDAWWDGTSSSKMQIANGILPAGTYFYILDTGDNSKPRTGIIYLNRNADSISF